MPNDNVPHTGKYSEKSGTQVNPNAGRNQTQVNPRTRQNAGTVINPNVSNTGGYYGTIQPGTIVAERFQIGDPIHTEGAEAIIFIATDFQTGGDVCFKVYIQGTHVRSEVRDKLLNLQHKNIARLLTWGEWSGQIYEVWTLYQGKTLLNVIRDRRFNERQIIPYLTQMNEALCAIHEAGIVHQDIKPANFMLVNDGTASGKLVLIDFGVSSASDSDGRTHVTKVGKTTEYAAPEVLFTDFCWKESDYYSLGVTLYEMQIGETPYSSLDKNEAMTRLDYIRSNVILRIKEFSEDMQNLIFGLMQYDKTERWGYTAVRSWLTGDYSQFATWSSIPVPSSGKKEVSFSFQRKTYMLPTQIGELVLHMAKEWNAGEACLDSNGRFFMLTDRLVGVDDYLAQVCNEPMRIGQDLHVHYFNKLYRLYPDLKPFVWRGLLLENYTKVGLAILNALWQKDIQTAFGNYNPFDFQNQAGNDNKDRLTYSDLEDIFMMRVISQYLKNREEMQLCEKIFSLESEIMSMKNSNNMLERDICYYRAAYILSGAKELRLKDQSFPDKAAFVAHVNKIIERCRMSGKNDAYLEFCKLIKPSEVDSGFAAWADVVAGIDVSKFLRNI